MKPTNPCTWSNPPLVFVKFNVDAIITKENCWIDRDDNENIFAIVG